MAATADSIIVAGSEVVTAFDRTTGETRWSSSMSDTSGATPVVVTADGVVVVAPGFEPVQAFDLATGEPASVPAGISLPAPQRPPRLPTGYATGPEGLTYHGKVIWSEPTDGDFYVARLGDLTVISDSDRGLRLVGDDGSVLAAPKFGRREYDAVPVLVDGPVAVTVTADGVLYAIGPART
jgi:outer membrane protein assembly factor BamB